MNNNYYDILGVDKNATPEEIKKAYRKMAIKYHPDKNNTKEAEDMFKKAAEAYDVLKDPNKKSQYDKYGRVGGNNQGFNSQSGFGFDMNDIFSQFGDIFGNSFNQGQGHRKTKKGSNLKIKVNLSIEDILNGVIKTVKYKRNKKCNTCDGTGGKNTTKCNTCNGLGKRIAVQETPFGQIRQEVICDQCNGEGNIIKDKCNTCNGNGYVIQQDTVNIDIPKGVSSDMKINMRGDGNYARGGGYGDLHVFINEIKEDYFNRDNNNILIEKEISVLDAILGNTIDVKTPRGITKLEVKKGTQNGHVARFIGKGIPDMNLGLGNMYIKIKVKIPTDISKNDEKILEKLKKSDNFN